MKSIKYLVVMICLISTSFITDARGQVYSNEALFYIRSDRSLDNENEAIIICKFDGDKMYTLHGNKKNIGKQLSEAVSYYDDFDKCYSEYPGYIGHNIPVPNLTGRTRKKGVSMDFDLFEIDTSVPSSSRTVYSNEWFFDQKATNERVFYAVSDDKSSIIRFRMDRDRTKVAGKVYYIKVEKDDILPKSLNPNELEFLNE